MGQNIPAALLHLVFAQGRDLWNVDFSALV